MKFDQKPQQLAMYWDDLRRIIRENETSNAKVIYYYDPKIDPLNIDIFDMYLTRRKPELLALTGQTAHDTWRDSLVCRAAFFNGMIPFQSGKGDQSQDSKFGTRIYRGVLDLLEKLMTEGCLRRTDDLRAIFRSHDRRFPTAA